MRDHVIAVDVGTTSARAGLFDRCGSMLVRTEYPILLHRPSAGLAEHDSGDIWSAVCRGVRDVMQRSGLQAARIAAVGFDATCSLVMRDRAGLALPVSAGDASCHDTIVWQDHRAMEEAAFCTRTAHPVLAQSGQIMSPEMQMPKIMWIKKHLPGRWKDTGYLFDLSDFLTWKATGSAARSLCTLSSKWNFQSCPQQGWDRGFLDAIGLSDLVERAHLPQAGVAPGHAVGTLSQGAALELGLDTSVLAGAGLIDAYAGMLGVLAGRLGDSDTLESQFALVAGTSSCVVSLSRRPQVRTGLWGPYFETLLPGLWLREGGQSASGALLDHIVRSHAAGGVPEAGLLARIFGRIAELRRDFGEAWGADLHVLPDFHGNRTPGGHAASRGVVSGLSLDHSFDGLCLLYWRTCVGIALGIRQIVDLMAQDVPVRPVLHVCGGHLRNPLMMELYRDISGCRIVVPQNGDAMLLGTAIAAAAAAGLYGSLAEAGKAMAVPGNLGEAPVMAGHYARDYQAFLLMQKHRAELEALP